MIIKDFKMSYEGYDNLSCTVPCTMYSVLLEHGIIEDPYYGLNEEKMTPLSDNDCTFTAEFEVDDTILSHEYTELVFYGLDTICDIWVNGKHIAHTMNMHRTYTFNVKGIIVAGKNEIRLDFSSPTKYFAQMENKHHLMQSTDMIDGACHLRKALCMSGWDWGPKLPDMGIFRKVELRAYDHNRIDDVLVLQYHKENKVELEIKVEAANEADCDIYVNIDNQRIKAIDGIAKVVIENPRLWWVRGYGEQYLYDLQIEMVKGDKVIDKADKKIGLRTLTVSTKRDELGSELCFIINGVRIFAMGANYIPQDNLLSRISKERTKKLIESCIDANYNCIRVWGGGYYPEDDFYDLCDEYGLMVWQDFMSACWDIWLTSEFELEYTNEAICNIKRFRNHPSLGILCGNNEIEALIRKDNELSKMDYLRLYERILPDLCEKLAPQTFYWPSSPSSGGGFEDSGNKLKGDSHYWEVWHGGIPFQCYRQYIFRFCSEFGFESYPSIKTIKTFAEADDMNCFSRVMENHQKCRDGNTKILTYIADNYLYPTSFENLVYTSQLLQADAIKYGVEHFRRMRGICMGAIYWQVNDCWPVASWSSIDYYGRYKALHYAAKKFFAPVAMGLFMEKKCLTVNISNETMQDFNGRVEIALCRADNSVINHTVHEISVDKLSAKDVISTDIEAENDYNNYIYADLYDEKGNFIMRQTELLKKPKHFEWLKPNIKLEFSRDGNTTKIAVSSDVFAKGVSIDFDEFDCVLSDNFFDLTNDKPYVITTDCDRSLEEMMSNVIIKTVYDIGK